MKISPAPIPALTAYEINLLRDALVEAISSINCVLDSSLPSQQELFSALQKSLYDKWTGRMGAYNSLLKYLGGKRHSSRMCWEDFARSEKSA